MHPSVSPGLVGYARRSVALEGVVVTFNTGMVIPTGEIWVIESASIRGSLTAGNIGGTALIEFATPKAALERSYGQTFIGDGVALDTMTVFLAINEAIIMEPGSTIMIGGTVAVDGGSSCLAMVRKLSVTSAQANGYISSPDVVG